MTDADLDGYFDEYDRRALERRPASEPTTPTPAPASRTQLGRRMVESAAADRRGDRARGGHCGGDDVVVAHRSDSAAEDGSGSEPQCAGDRGARDALQQRVSARCASGLTLGQPGAVDWQFVDVDRHGSLLWLAGLSMVLAVVVLRWRGLLAALGSRSRC
jgi:hypothetical protein